MGVVVQLMRAPALVTQEDIEALIGLQNQIRNLQRMYDKQAAALLDLLVAGAEVETGTHTAEVEHIRKRGALITRLNIY